MEVPYRADRDTAATLVADVRAARRRVELLVQADADLAEIAPAADDREVVAAESGVCLGLPTPEYGPTLARSRARAPGK